MATFVLVHGAWHGAWCWSALEPELAARGYQSIAVDLPCEDAAATFDDYATVVVAAAECVEAPVLVGHSLGSISISMAALRTPAAHVVHLCGVLPPVAGMPHDDEPPQSDDSVFAALVRHPDGSHEWGDEDAAIAAMYADCPEAVARDAVRRLRRQQTAMWDVLTPLPAWPQVRTSYVVCDEDRMIHPEWSRWACARWLGIDPIEMPGSHSPMLARPAELADQLAGLVATH
jgi:pimeloyl-ACP methyl ester carboxylesterase